MCSKGLGAIVGLFILLSCSVKENRTLCPCALTIELYNLPSPVSVQVVAGDHRATYTARQDTVMLVQVPKGKIRLMAVCGTRLEPEENLEIPFGYECPPVYLYSDLVNTLCDSTRVNVQLNKHFCTLSLSFDGPNGWGEPFWAQIRGNVNGLDREGQPTEGDFSCRLDAGFTVRLPRQAPDEELWLDISMPDQVVRSFALGTYMQQAGYDWTAPDLDDLPLQIQLSVTELLLLSGLWKTEIPIEADI
jgi:hypothetical protein